MRNRARAFVVCVAAIVPLVAGLAAAAPAGASSSGKAATYMVVLKGNQKAGSRPSSRREAGSSR